MDTAFQEADLAVVRAALTSMSMDRGQVIMRETKPDTVTMAFHEGQEWARVSASLLAEFDDLSEEAITDFRAKNGLRYDLLRLVPHLASEFVLLSSAELAMCLQHDLGWHTFGRRYPNSDGVVGFSRVGVDSGMTHGLLYLERRSGVMPARGAYSLFRNEGGVWRPGGYSVAWTEEDEGSLGSIA